MPVILTLLIIFLAGVRDSSAQATYIATLSPVDINGFPHLKAYLDVHDPSGAFVHGLKLQDVTIQENGVQVPVTELHEQKPGVQFVIAITAGEPFIIRDAQGITRYEHLLKGLVGGTWSENPSGEDDYSLLTMGGPQLIHSSNPVELRSALESYKADDPKAIPSLEILASALQVASDPTDRPGMERAILFITPPQSADVSTGLQSIIASAAEQNIHIYVWLVASREVFDLPEIDQLRNLADQTRAAFFAFSYDETVPDLETLLEPLRYIYQLGYDSKVAAAGTQQVTAQVNIGTEKITTQPQSFEIDLLSPAPTILNPPTEIIRNFPSRPTPGTTVTNNDLMPVEKVLTIEVTFPDGFERSLTHTSLYVDGTVVAENTSPPFEQFIWDLRSYTQDGVHTLSVEAVDNLGLIGKTGEITVKVVVPTTTQGVILAVSQKRPLIIGATVFVSASILVLVLIIGGRIRPKPHPG
ncbi:MAG TPA: Ig-like domain-containing protein, partial [Anaerolineales bacterium]